MGLDITAYSKLEPSKRPHAAQEDEDRYDPTLKEHWVRESDGAQGHLGDIKPGLYNYWRAFGFRAGSYSGYNAWRRELCLMALNVEPDDVWKKPDKFKNRPFVELINFSDCEGAIGTDVSKKLAEDFADNFDKALAYTPSHKVPKDWFIECYVLWKTAFEEARYEGLVDFH